MENYKCKYCDSVITLEEDECPNCGASTSWLQEHIRKEEQDIEIAKEKVRENVRQARQMDDLKTAYQIMGSSFNIPYIIRSIERTIVRIIIVMIVLVVFFTVLSFYVKLK